MKMIIDIPSNIHVQLILLASKDGRKTKPYVERLVIAHVDRKNKVSKDIDTYYKNAVAQSQS